MPFYRSKEIIEKIQGQNPSNPLFISEERFQEVIRQTGTPIEGDLLLTSRGTLGIPYLVKASDRFHFADGNLTWFRHFNGIDSTFLKYYFLSPGGKAALARCIIGSSQPAYTIAALKTISVPLPPLPIQRRIAGILSAYDDLIENNQRRIKILDDMARALYREWFVDFRFPGHESVPRVDSPLGKIPEGWSPSTVGAESEVVMGQSPKSEFYNDCGDGLPFHQGVTHFGSHFPHHMKFCTLTSRVAETGDTLVSVRAPVGRINIADTRIVIGRGLSAVRPTNQFPRFHYWQLREVFREEDSMGGGTIFKAITKGDLLTVPWLVPSHQILDRFEEVERPMFELLTNLTLRTQNLRRTRDLLLPRLLSGQIDVSKVQKDQEIAA